MIFQQNRIILRPATDHTILADNRGFKYENGKLSSIPIKLEVDEFNLDALQEIMEFLPKVLVYGYEDLKELEDLGTPDIVEIQTLKNHIRTVERFYHKVLNKYFSTLENL